MEIVLSETKSLNHLAIHKKTFLYTIDLIILLLIINTYINLTYTTIKITNLQVFKSLKMTQT